ncbi:MAG TPA: ABC transporter permease, partial [Vicinamibacterales bacterium]|nr:ABC transporter permease [Vicinamibacterales bacterium]
MRAFFHTIAARIRGFLRPGDIDADFDREMAAHLEMAEADGIRRGLSIEEARRAARVQLGGVTQLRESWRAASGLPWLDGVALDARLGIRMLRRSWGLTLAGGLAMTIVITIAAVVFVFLDEFMGRTAPPLDEGDRVVALQSWDAEAHRRRDVSRRDLERWSTTLQSVEDLGGFQTIERRLIVEGRPAEWVRVAEITASGFRLARVAPMLGRWIADADERAAAEPIVVIGYDVWQTRFAADRAVIGRTVRLGEIHHTVVGVMPEGFAFPVNHRYWIPLRAEPFGSLKASPDGVVFGRLARGVSLEGAQAELSIIGLLPPDGRSTAQPPRPRVVPYTFAFTDDVERGELAWQQRIILLLVSLLLVPPCLNIAILIYARTITRQEEFAARFALGASRGRIVMQLCLEVLVLSSAA